MPHYFIDMDPGIDDAVAMCVLNKYAKQDVKLFVASYGNMPQFRTSNNMLTMLEELNWDDVDVVLGAKEADTGKYENAAHIHGVDGLGGIGKTYKKQTTFPNNYEDAIYNKAKELQEVEYMAVGPLTTLADVYKKHPDVTNYIKRVVIMGGGFEQGNITKYAEFNIYTDPKAANIVFKNFKNIQLAPLNLTTNIFYDFDDINKLVNEGNISELCAHILTQCAIAGKHYGEPGAIMHDPTAAVMLCFPEIFKYEATGVYTITEGEHFGETKKSPTESNVSIGEIEDTNVVLDLITKSFRKS